MGLRTKDELTEKFNKIVGENVNDEVLEFMEDLSDTLDANVSENWKTKYEDNDKMWRERYRSRFLGNRDEEIETTISETTDVVKKLSYDDLFKSEV